MLRAAVLGRVFVREPGWREPEALQVTGWAPARADGSVSVFARRVRVAREAQDAGGGRGRVDAADVLGVREPATAGAERLALVWTAEGEPRLQRASLLPAGEQFARCDDLARTYTWRGEVV